MTAIPTWVTFPGQDWQSITPQAAGLNPDRFETCLATLHARGAASGGEDRSGRQWGAVLNRGGYLRHPSWGDGSYRFQTASTGKAFIWALVGLAVADGLLDPDRPIRERWTGHGRGTAATMGGPHWTGGAMRLWGGRFTEGNDPLVADFTRSIEVDRELAPDDIAGSIAHVRGLGRAGLVSAEEVEALVRGLEDLGADIEAGRLEWDPSLEDVHLNLEVALGRRVGVLAGKLHTGRSRNDQVATDLRLWLRRTVAALDAAALDMERALVDLAHREGDAVLPGTTHIQPAQPVLLAHHLLAYVEMLERDRGRLADALRRANVSPLGAGALAGAGYPLDREATASELGFDGVTRNSLDAVSDRDFVVETLAALALVMVHLSRLAEEITWWSNPRFGFVRVADAFSTGSSMMPNKKNPDPAELVRGRVGRVVGALTGTLTMLKGLPLAYQRDLQEDKPPLFDAAATTEASLRIMAGLIGTMSIDRARMAAAATEGFTTATAVADALVRRGVPFRAAHHLVGALVGEAERRGLMLDAIPDDAILAALAAADDETASRLATEPGTAAAVRASASIEGALAGADVIGGTSRRRVAEALRVARERLASGG